MAKRGKGGSKGYTNPSGVKLSGTEVDKLKKAIKYYNSRIKRAQAIIGDSTLLPPHYNYSETIDKFRTKSSVNAFIKDLERYNAKTLQLTSLESTGEAITKAEYELIKDRIARENRRRKKLKRLVDEQQKEIGFFKTDNEKLLRPIDINKYGSLERLRAASNRFAEDRLYTRAEEWKQRYIDKVNYNIGLAIIAGFDPNGEEIEKMKRIVGYLESLDTLENITRAAYASPAMDITITSDEVYLQQNIDEIYSAWDEFMGTL